MPTDTFGAQVLEIEDWLTSAPCTLPQASLARMARLSGYPRSPRAKRSVGVYTSQ